MPDSVSKTESMSDVYDITYLCRILSSSMKLLTILTRACNPHPWPRSLPSVASSRTHRAAISRALIDILILSKRINANLIIP